MKKVTFFFVLTLFCQSVFSQDLEGLLGSALKMQENGDNNGLASTLTSLSGVLEKEVEDGEENEFSKGLKSQMGGLKALIPLASKGEVKAGPLQKLINTIRMLAGANRVKKLLGGKSGGLGSNLGALSSGLNLMKAGSSVLGDKSSGMSSLLDGALGNVSKLGGGGVAAKAAEPALTKQLGGILDLAKGIL
jgi:hypothetical protein